MKESSDEDPRLLQHDVQRLLGRSMLRLQQYEGLIKAIMVDHEISGAVDDLEAIQAKRADSIARKTLGTLVGDLLGSYLVSGKPEPAPETAADPTDVSAHVSFRMQICLREEDLAQTEAELKELVQLRNGLVHHFLEEHDIRSADGCRRAQDALILAHDRIDQCLRRLRDLADDMLRVRKRAAEYVQSETFRQMVIHGIMPDGSVDWPASSLVSDFREAARALVGVEGDWVSVSAAATWIVATDPDKSPGRFGCKTWQQALQESKLFDLRHVQRDGRRVICFKVKANPRIEEAPERTWEIKSAGTSAQGA